MKKIKIVHLITSHHPHDTRILRRECLSLSEIDEYEVVLLNSFGVDEKFSNVCIKSFDKRRSRFNRYTISVIKSIFAVYREAPDIIHIHDPELFIFVRIYKLMGIKVIVDIHEKFEDKFDMREWIPSCLSTLLAHLFNYILNHVDLHADGIIVAAPDLCSRYKNKNLYSITNYPDVEFISSLASNGPREENVIIYTGGLTQYRGIECVIKSLLKCSAEWRLVVYGSISDTVVSNLGDALNDKRISIKGVVPYDEIILGMKTATVGVLCNEKGFGYEHSMPNKLFEYMACGLPVVCTNFPEWSAIIEPHQLGMVCDPYDSTSVNSAICHYLWNKDVSGATGKRGLANVLTTYNWRLEKKKLFNLYDVLI